MKLYEIVQKGVFINNVLNQFAFTLFDKDTESFFTIEKPTIKDFVHLCNREVDYIDIIETDDVNYPVKIDITIRVDFKKDKELYYIVQKGKYNA